MISLSILPGNRPDYEENGLRFVCKFKEIALHLYYKL